MAPLSPAVEMKYLIDYLKVAAGRHISLLANRVLRANTTMTCGYFHSYPTQINHAAKEAQERPVN